MLALLPLLTTAIGLGGFTVGVCSFLSPSLAAWIYGCSAPSSRNELRYLHSLSIRNFSTGLTVLAITAFWRSQWKDRYGEETPSNEARLAVQRVLGLVILLGSVVPVCDALVCRSGGGETDCDSGMMRKKKGKTEEPGKDGMVEDFMNGATGWAGYVHATRSIFWIIGGLWCLFG